MGINDYTAFKDEMFQLIGGGYDNLEKCLSKISTEIRPDEHDLRQLITMLQAQLSTQKGAETKGLSVEEKEKNALTFRVMNCVDEFVRSRQSELFFEKILVVSFDEHTMKKMDKFLNPTFFKGEIRRDASQELREDLADGCDFVLFDNYHCPEQNSKYRQDLLDDYLASQKTNAVLSFGAWINNYDPTKVYPHKFFAANSPFSLYARIRELREFLKIHGKPESPF